MIQLKNRQIFTAIRREPVKPILARNMSFLPTSLQRDLIRRHIGPFIFCFLTLMFLLLMQFLILYIDKIVGKGIPFHIVIDLIFSNIAAMVVMAVPMSILVSTLMAYGQFSEHNELTALKAGGINPLKAMSPMLVVSVLLCIGLAWFQNYVLPEANYHARSLFIDIRLKKPGFDLKPNVFYEGLNGYTFLVKRIPSDSDSLYDITLFQESSPNNNFAVIKAQKGLLHSESDKQTLTLFLYNGNMIEYLNDYIGTKRLIERTSFNKYRISFDLSDLAFSRSNPKRYGRDERTMSAQAMLAVVDTLRNDIHDEQKRYLSHFDPIIAHIPDSTSYLERSRLGLPQATRKVDDGKGTDFKKPLHTRYVVLNSMPSFEKQKYLSQIGESILRQASMNYENMGLNLQWRYQRIAQYMVEVWKKLAIPVGCIIFVLIGAPLGMLTRKGNLGYAALFSAIIFTFYWSSMIQGEKMADHMTISPFSSMWFSNIVLAIVGLFLILKIYRERIFRR